MKEMLNTLIRRSFAASRVRNLIAVLAIALTTVLFTSVTTIGLGAVSSMTLTMQMLKGSKSDGDFRYMNEEQFQALQNADFVERAGLRRPVGFLTNTKRHNIELDVLDEIQAELTFCNPSHGRMPEKANEIVTSDLALKDLDAKPEIGAEVTIEFTAHGQEYSLPMVVSGWYEATNDQMSTMVGGASFAEAYPEIFQDTYHSDKDMAGTYFSDFTVKSTVNKSNLQEKMDEFARSIGGNPDDMEADNYLMAVVNTMTNPKPDAKLIVMAAAFVTLFAFCGYLLIYNVFDIAVMQEIRRYGLYRTIGMGKRQVKKLINRQALWLSCMGIPLGLAAGYMIGRKTLPIVMNMLSSEYKNIVVDAKPSPVIFLGAAALAAVTVFISTRKPVRVAANIPPIEAFHYVESSTGKRTRKKSTPTTNVYRMAWSNIGRNKRRSVFIIISLVLCVVLLNCAGTAAGSLDIEKQVAYMIRTDFAVVNAVSTNGQKGFTLREQALSSQTIADIAAQPGVTDGAPVYKNTLEDTDVTYDFGMEFVETRESFYSALMEGMTKEDFGFVLGDDGKPICNVYGMNESAISRMSIQEGETDAHVLYEKMKKGEGILLGSQADRQTLKIDPIFDFLDVGDVITVYKDGMPVKELPVLAKAALNGDDEEIGYTVNGPLVVGGDGLFLYLPDSIYMELYDEPSIYKYAFNVDEKQRDNMTAFLDNYMENTDTSINYMSAASARENSEATRTMIQFVGGLIGIIFGIAGVLNLINTLITTILARRHEFATMQSIGMTRRQLMKMLTAEGIYYALCACIAGMILAVVLDFTLVRGILNGIWYFTFQFTLIPAIVTSLILLAAGAVVPVIALRIFNKGSIVEQLRVAE